MEWERDFTIDDREQQLASDMTMVSMLMARTLENLEWFDQAQVFTGDGCRNLSEWVAARLDLSTETARSLVRTMRRTQDKPHLRQALADGTASFDRVEALSRLDGETDLLQHLDVGSLHRAAADRVEITPDDEADAVERRHLVVQPTLDRSWWKVWGGLDGVIGAVVDKTLTDLAEQLPALPDGTRPNLAWRKATALYELASGGQSPHAEVTVFVDAGQAAPTSARAGMRLEAGPRVGPQALEAILCDSVSEVTVFGDDAIPMRYGRRARTSPPALRRAILARTGGHCSVFGCDSRYRVEVHHKTPWSQGGTTDPEGLVAVCWFHHQIAIHEHRFTIHTDPQGRVVLRRPGEAARQTVTASRGRAKG